MTIPSMSAAIRGGVAALSLLAILGCNQTEQPVTTAPVIAPSADAPAPIRLSGDFIAVRGQGTGQTAEQAGREAYYGVFDRALTAVAGNQAAGPVGQQFRRAFERDFDAFRARYFSPDTMVRCMQPSPVQALCEVQGLLRRTSLEADVRTAVRNTEQTLSNSLVFVLSAAESRDQRTVFVVDRLSGQFTQFGHRIVTGSAANSAIAGGRVDYSLGIYEVTFSRFTHDPFESRMSGSAIVRFRLNNPRNRTEVANLPVQVSATLSGPSADVLQHEMVSELSSRAAAEIARKVNEAVITSQQERQADDAGRARQAGRGALYLFRLEGTNPAARDRIAAVRQAIANAIPGSTSEVDPTQSDARRTTLRVTTPARVVPDDVADALHRVQQGSNRFSALYSGNNEFDLSF
jgi:hypothetical protein